MLALASYFFIASLLSAWIAIFVLSRHLEKVRSTSDQPHPEAHSITESFFVRVEALGGKIGRQSRDVFYKMAYEVLKRFVPRFREFTRKSEGLLSRWIRLIKGKREINYLGRDAASPFVQEMRNHSDHQSGGSIEG